MCVSVCACACAECGGRVRQTHRSSIIKSSDISLGYVIIAVRSAANVEIGPSGPSGGVVWNCLVCLLFVVRHWDAPAPAEPLTDRFTHTRTYVKRELGSKTKLCTVVVAVRVCIRLIRAFVWCATPPSPSASSVCLCSASRRAHRPSTCEPSAPMQPLLTAVMLRVQCVYVYVCGLFGFRNPSARRAVRRHSASHSRR